MHLLRDVHRSLACLRTAQASADLGGEHDPRKIKSASARTSRTCILVCRSDCLTSLGQHLISPYRGIDDVCFSLKLIITSPRLRLRSAKADENIRAIGPADLPAAVDACIDAAGHEFDVPQQKALLRAAAYGRAFCAKFPRDRFQEVCKVGGSNDASV